MRAAVDSFPGWAAFGGEVLQRPSEDVWEWGRLGGVLHGDWLLALYDRAPEANESNKEVGGGRPSPP